MLVARDSSIHIGECLYVLISVVIICTDCKVFVCLIVFVGADTSNHLCWSGSDLLNWSSSYHLSWSNSHLLCLLVEDYCWMLVASMRVFVYADLAVLPSVLIVVLLEPMSVEGRLNHIFHSVWSVILLTDYYTIGIVGRSRGRTKNMKTINKKW